MGLMADIDYDDIDPEMRDLVRALNRVPGVVTVDSCFGHPGRECNHHSHAFVGVVVEDGKSEEWEAFWRHVFPQYGGKLDVLVGWVQFTLHSYPYEPYSLYRLTINPQHDPGKDKRGWQEKLNGIAGFIEIVEGWSQLRGNSEPIESAG